ncbi:MAG: alkaline shock response membrane anchor protein AmaP [Peptococcaceae bacterium]|nr:alkaline shock response membrane anchor protein AmaP [Peptococcaceae bacterium]
MRLIDKLLFLLLALCFTALGILMIYSVLNAQMVIDVVADLLLHSQWLVVIAGAVIAFIGIFLVLNMLFTKKEKIAKVSGNDIGQVTMSMEAIQSMINRTVSNIGGIKEVTPKLKIVGDKVAICLHITVQSDMIVPELGTTIQKAVKEDLETMAGVSIAEIKVLVSSVEEGAGGKQGKSYLPSFKKAAKNDKDVKGEKEEPAAAAEMEDGANAADVEPIVAEMMAADAAEPITETKQAEEEKAAVSE